MLPYYVFLNLGYFEMIAGAMGDEVKVPHRNYTGTGVLGVIKLHRYSDGDMVGKLILERTICIRSIISLVDL
jgi:hypothetical protein